MYSKPSVARTAFRLFRILADSSELWKNICRTAKANGQLGDSLTLRCANHPDQEVKVTSAKVHSLCATGLSWGSKVEVTSVKVHTLCATGLSWGSKIELTSAKVHPLPAAGLS